MGRLVPVEYGHLAQVADLLESTFPTWIQGSRSSHEFLKVLRWLAQNRPFHLFPTRGWIPEVGFKGWVWLEDARVVGHAAVYPIRGQRALVLVNVAVDPAYRRRGIGTQLVQAAMREAQRLRVYHLWLEVEEHNREARALYRKLGFTRVLRTWRWRWSPRDEQAGRTVHVEGEPLPLHRFPRALWSSIYPWLRAWYPRWCDWRYPVECLERLRPPRFPRLWSLWDRERVRAWYVGPSGRPRVAAFWWYVPRWNEQWLFLAAPCGLRPGVLQGLLRPLRRFRYTFVLDVPADLEARTFYQAGFVLWRRLEVWSWTPR